MGDIHFTLLFRTPCQARLMTTVLAIFFLTTIGSHSHGNQESQSKTCSLPRNPPVFRRLP
jgi:hypothetical protein